MGKGGRGKATQSRESDADEDGSAEHETHKEGIERPISVVETREGGLDKTKTRNGRTAGMDGGGNNMEGMIARPPATREEP